MSWSYTYTERLNGETVELTLPDTRAQLKELWQEVSLLAETDPQRWKAAFRMWSAADLGFLALATSFAQRKDAWTGRLEIDCDFQFNFGRWVQFESDDKVDKTAREHWKSTWRHVRLFQEIFREPNITAGIFSESLKKSANHLVRWKIEAETNAVLKTAWNEVLYWDPKNEGAFWSVENGCSVKRTVVSVVPTVSAHTFMKGLPTGARFTILLFDDVETEESVENEDMRAKAKSRFRSALNLGGRGCRKWIAGTHHHPDGLLAQIIDEGWASHCFPAEDVTKPAPDIAALYDEYGGVRPDTGADIPAGVREIRLAGAPVFLHPMECATKRFEQTDEVYETQSMGNPLSGQTHRFLPEWVDDELRIASDLMEFAAGKYGYLFSDASRGLGDPSVGLVLAAGADRTLTVVDGFRAKLAPERWAHEMYMLTVNWSNVMPIRQIRVEVFGQATWDHVLREYFRGKHYNGPPIYGSGTYRAPGPLGTKLMRAWLRLQPLFKDARLRLPKELWVTDEKGKLYDLIDYFIKFEYLKFPLPHTDDIFDTLALIGEPEDKVPAIEYPSAEIPWQDHDRDIMHATGVMPGIEEESWLWQ